MTRFFITLLVVAPIYLFMLYPLAATWNERSRAAAVSYTALVVLAVVIWQGAWGWAG